MTAHRPIRTQQDVDAGAAWLAEVEPRFAHALTRTGPLPLRLKPDGFAGLCDVIVSQQVSVASANAIRARMAAAKLTEAATVRRAGEDGLRAAGLSRPKARYLRLLAEDEPDYAALHGLEDAALIDRLTQITGIGPWTAQVYAMFCMGRADIFPPGDLALQVSAAALFDLPARPAPAALEERARAWSPWRSVAARALFAYYRVIKDREGLG